MKNQLRKATLRAAALTMSATIAATSVPMTAFAQDTNEGNDGEQKKQVSENPTDEENVQNYEDKTVAPAIATADEKVDDINLSVAENIATKERKENVEIAQSSTEAAKTAEETVKTDTGIFIEKKSDIDTKVGSIEKAIEDAKLDLKKYDNDQVSINEKISQTQEDINNAEYREDAQKLYDAAIAEAKDADDKFNLGKEYLGKKTEELNAAVKELNTMKGAYETAITTGLSDLKVVQDNITTAQEKVDALQAQVNTAAKNNVQTAAELLAEEYNKTDADKEKIFETILKDYYLGTIDKNAVYVGVKYDRENDLYAVAYKSGEDTNNIYVGFEYSENGIKITRKEPEEKVVTEADEEHWTVGNTRLSKDGYDAKVKSGDIIEKDNKSYVVDRENLKD